MTGASTPTRWSGARTPPRCCRSRTSRAIATGRGYAGLLDPKNTSTRYDAVMQTGGRDVGAGVPYQTEYCLLTGPDGATRLWIEDIGRWFAGPDGKPGARARRRARRSTSATSSEERLAYLSRFDGLTGEMNRMQLTEVLDDRARRGA